MSHSIVVLGDSGVGKTSLLRALQNVEDATDCQPTVGAESQEVIMTANGASYNLTFWDWAGNERFLSAESPHMIAADACILAFDVTSRDSFDALTSWHDEFLQSGNDRSSNPAIIVVGCKSDVTTAREVEFSAAVGWCSAEPVDPSLSPNECLGGLSLQPPYVEVSSEEGTGVDALKSVLLERLLLRERVKAHFLSLPQNPFAHVEGKGFHVAVMGDAERGKDIALGTNQEEFPAVEAIEKDLQRACVMTKKGDMTAWAPPSSTSSDAFTYFRGAHVCLLMIKLSIQPMVHRVALWREVFVRESGLRDPRSIPWIVIGCRAADYISESSAEVAQYCSRNGCYFLEFPESPTQDFVDKAWNEIATYTVEHRCDLIIDRSASHSKYQRKDWRKQRKQSVVQDQDAPESEESASVPDTQPVSGQVDASLAALHRLHLSSDLTFTAALKDHREQQNAEIESLRAELQGANETIANQAEQIKDIQLEFRLVWEEFQKLAAANQHGPQE